MTFDTLISKEPKTELEAMLCEAIASLGAQPGFANKTYWEIFDEVREMSKYWVTPGEVPMNRDNPDAASGLGPYDACSSLHNHGEKMP